MKKDEVPPHWSGLVTQYSESSTDANIDVASTWAAEDFTHEGD